MTGEIKPEPVDYDAARRWLKYHNEDWAGVYVPSLAMAFARHRAKYATSKVQP